MTIEEKISLIKEQQENSIAALNKLLDQLYNLTDSFYDENNNFITSDDRNIDIAFAKFVKGLRKEISYYENVREKLIKNDFNLSLLEINYIGLAFVFVNQMWKKQVEDWNKAIEESQEIIDKLIDNASEQLKFPV